MSYIHNKNINIFSESFYEDEDIKYPTTPKQSITFKIPSTPLKKRKFQSKKEKIDSVIDIIENLTPVFDENYFDDINTIEMPSDEFVNKIFDTVYEHLMKQ